MPNSPQSMVVCDMYAPFYYNIVLLDLEPAALAGSAELRSTRLNVAEEFVLIIPNVGLE
jgi:hypothetical protein